MQGLRGFDKFYHDGVGEKDAGRYSETGQDYYQGWEWDRPGGRGMGVAFRHLPGIKKVQEKGREPKMSKDGMTDRERAAGCTISDVMPEGTIPTLPDEAIGEDIAKTGYHGGSARLNVEEPDSYLSQDASNQFRSIFFQGGDYSRPGLVITDLVMVGAVVLRGIGGGGEKYIFMVRTGKGEVKFEYGSNDEAQIDRTKLLMQIEEYHSGGRK